METNVLILFDPAEDEGLRLHAVRRYASIRDVREQSEMKTIAGSQFDQDVWVALIVAVISAGLFVALLVVRFARGADPTLRTWLMGSGVVSVALFAEAGVNNWAPYRTRWRWDLALFPAVLVAIQGLNVYRARRFTGVAKGTRP